MAPNSGKVCLANRPLTVEVSVWQTSYVRDSRKTFIFFRRRVGMNRLPRLDTKEYDLLLPILLSALPENTLLSRNNMICLMPPIRISLAVPIGVVDG